MTNVYRSYNLSILYPTLQRIFPVFSEGEFLTVSSASDCATIPPENDVLIYTLTIAYLCQMDTALYPTEKISWCPYPLL